MPAEDACAAFIRLFRYMTQWRGAFAAMAALLMLSMACDLVTPLFIESSINAISFGRGIYVHFDVLTRSVAAFVLFSVFAGIMECILGRISAKITLNISKQLRQDAFDSVMNSSVSSFDGMLQGDLMSRIMNDSEMAAGAFSETFRELACSLVMLTGCTVIMLLKSPVLAVVSISSSLVSVGIMGLLSGLVFPVLSEQQASLGRLNAHIEENIKTFRTCKAAGRMEDNNSRMDLLSREYCDLKIRAGKFQYFMGPVMLLLGNLNFLLTLIFGISLIISGSITVGSLQAFFMYSRLFIEPVNSLGEYFIRAQNALAGAERVFSLIDKKKESEDLAEAAARSIREQDENLNIKGKRVPAGTAANAAESLPAQEKVRENGFLVFDSVRFAYRRNFPVLKGVSLKIREGEKLALIGRTGEGKTTLTSLLLLFYPDYTGSITLEGQEIRRIDPAALRSRIAVVSQEPRILNGTVYENLIYGCKGVDRDDVRKILQEMGVFSMFSRLPDGLDTQIRNIGSNMSQGQLQMICLARALLRNASILILDEATSSLDPDTELMIKQGMETAMQGKTCILIAHRISSVRDADHIAVLSDGVIAEYGTHEDLMEDRGLYYKLYRTQFSGKEI